MACQSHDISNPVRPALLGTSNASVGRPCVTGLCMVPLLFCVKGRLDIYFEIETHHQNYFANPNKPRPTRVWKLSAIYEGPTYCQSYYLSKCALYILDMGFPPYATSCYHPDRKFRAPGSHSLSNSTFCIDI